MIEVVDTDAELDLTSLLQFAPLSATGIRWLIKGLEYSGDAFNSNPSSFWEKKSRDLWWLNGKEFSDFVVSVNQIIEGEFCAFDPVKDELLLSLVISDGTFWCVGGALGERFISHFQLKKLQRVEE